MKPHLPRLAFATLLLVAFITLADTQVVTAQVPTDATVKSGKICGQFTYSKLGIDYVPTLRILDTGEIWVLDPFANIDIEPLAEGDYVAIDNAWGYPETWDEATFWVYGAADMGRAPECAPDIVYSGPLCAQFLYTELGFDSIPTLHILGSGEIWIIEPLVDIDFDFATLNGGEYVSIVDARGNPYSWDEATFWVLSASSLQLAPYCDPTPKPLTINFRSTSSVITQPKGCVTLLWDVENGLAASLDNVSVDLHGSKEVCPTATTTYRLDAADPSRQPVPTASQSLTIQVNVAAPPPNTEVIAVPPSTVADIRTATVKSGNVNLRAGPGTDTARVGSASAGQTFTVVDQNADGSWLKICCYGDQNVWIAAFLVTLGTSPGTSTTIIPKIPTDNPEAGSSAQLTAEERAKLSEIENALEDFDLDAQRRRELAAELFGIAINTGKVLFCVDAMVVSLGTVTALAPEVCGSEVAEAIADLIASDERLSQDYETSTVTLANFEDFGVWRAGNHAGQSSGTFTQSSAQYNSFSHSGMFSYNFPEISDNFLDFHQKLPIPGFPTSMSISVYGDGSGSFLNVWICTQDRELWQYTFGQIHHANEWRTMTTDFDTTRGWPVQMVDTGCAPSTDPKAPNYIAALILDYPTMTAHSGTVYVDDLKVTTNVLTTQQR